MSNSINLGSVNLGTPVSGDAENRPAFFAEYIPSPAPDPGSACELPPALTLDLTHTPLVPLVPACAFQFPDVIPLPPVFNPQTVKFAACESLSATSNVTTCSTTRNSSLVLRASGPDPSSSGGPSECSIVLEGNLCADACSTFHAEANVHFSKAAANANSFLVIDAASTPDCGLNLRGNIEVDACPAVSVDSAVQFVGAAAGSYLTLAAAQDHCGVVLDGIIGVTACESFSAVSKVQFTGAGVSGDIVLSPSSSPNCGLVLDGTVAIQACTDFTASSNVVLGTAYKDGSSLELTATGFPNCGVTLSGSLGLDAVCTEFTVSGGINIGGKGVKTNEAISATASSTPGCGIKLQGDILIDACTAIEVENNVIFNGASGGELYLQASPDADCKIALVGEINTPECNTFTVTAKAASESDKGKLTFKTVQGTTVGYIELEPEITVDVGTGLDTGDGLNASSSHGGSGGGGGGGCGVTLHSAIYDAEIMLDIIQLKDEQTMEIVSGCDYTASDAISLNYEGNTLSLKGSIPQVCYTCDATGLDDRLVKDVIEVGKVYTSSVESACGASTGSLDFNTATLNFDAGASSATLAAGSLSLVDGSGSATLTPQTLTIGGYELSVQGVEMCVNGTTQTVYILMHT